MILTISPEEEKFINQEISAGAYNSVDEVIEAALRALKRRNELLRLSDEQLRLEILKFMKDIERKGIFDFESDDYFLLSQEIERRKLAK